VNADGFAALLCDWCLETAEGQRVLVSATSPAEPLVVAVHRALLERGAGWLRASTALPRRRSSKRSRRSS